MSSSTTSSAMFAAISAPSSKAAVPEDSTKLSHHSKNGKTFINPWPSWREQSAWSIVTSLLWMRISGKWKDPDTTPPTVIVRKPTFLPSRQTESLRATWLGHACYYVEFPNGLRVLFDPVFTPRCSPFSFMGPKRFTDVPCQIDDIPIVDAVVISHNHYDHLSYPTVMKIKEKHPNAHYFAGLGTKKWFTSIGVHNITEMDWWESMNLRLSPSQPSTSTHENAHLVEPSSSNTETSDITATFGCLPCQHMSARSTFDKAHSLWASWSVESGGKKIYFGGDTGYRSIHDKLPDDVDDYDEKFNYPHCPAFKEIGHLRGPFDLGLIPIGAYSPRWIMSPMHANPFDSVNIFVETRCKRAMGIHWGTWVLTDEDVLEPPRLLKTALKQHDIAEEGVFDVCEIGESRTF